MNIILNQQWSSQQKCLSHFQVSSHEQDQTETFNSASVNCAQSENEIISWQLASANSNTRNRPISFRERQSSNCLGAKICDTLRIIQFNSELEIFYSPVKLHKSTLNSLFYFSFNFDLRAILKGLSRAKSFIKEIVFVIIYYFHFSIFFSTFIVCFYFYNRFKISNVPTLLLVCSKFSNFFQPQEAF